MSFLCYQQRSLNSRAIFFVPLIKDKLKEEPLYQSANNFFFYKLKILKFSKLEPTSTYIKYILLTFKYLPSYILLEK